METDSKTALIKILLIVLVTTLSCTVFHCAAKGPPSGGPEDKTPPEVSVTVPEPGELNVSLNTKIRIGFSERMKRESVESGVFISPLPEEEPEIEWKGWSGIEIEFRQPLMRERTYVVTVGTQAKDMRNNAMAQTYSLAFSTGSKIDKGIISGTLYGDFKMDQAYVFAYSSDDKMDFSPDTLRPDYVTQPGADGSYRFEYLAPGAYRLYAVVDKGSDGEYDPGKDEIGVPGWMDIMLEEPEFAATGADFRTTLVDTTKPRLLSFYALDRRMVSFRATEPLMLPESTDSFSVTSVFDSIVVNPVSYYPDAIKKETIYLIFDYLTAEREYTMHINGVTDSSGNALDSASTVQEFTAVSFVDTIPPKLLRIDPKSGSKFFSVDKRLVLYFNEALGEGILDEALEVFREDSILFSVNLRPVWLNKWEVFPENGWERNASYTARVEVGLLADVYGNSPAPVDTAIADSFFVVAFSVMSADTFGIISGTLKDSAFGGGKTFVTAVPIGKEGKRVTAIVGENGGFSMENVLPGDYFLEAYYDADGDGSYSYGSIYPFVRAERFTVGTDTVSVRARWETAGHNIELPDW